MKPGAALACAAIALGGCDTTHFQSPPGASLSACDERFVGAWLIAEPDEDKKGCESGQDCEVLVIEAHCSGWHVLTNGRERDEDREMMRRMHMAFVDLHGRKLLSIGIDAEPKDLESGKMKWSPDHLFARYDTLGSVIRLYLVDADRIKHLIAAKAVRGRTETVTHQTTPGKWQIVERNHYVEGDAKEMARVALLPGVFEDHPALLLKPADPIDIVKPDPESAPTP